MTQTHDRAGELRNIAQTLLDVRGVEAVDVHSDDPRLQRPTLEATIQPDDRGVPASVLSKLGDADVAVESITPRGHPRHYVVVAV